MKSFPIIDYNKFPENIYFHKIVNEIIKIGNLKKTKKTILDFGCGNKIFSKKLPHNKILNYDLHPDLTEIKNYKNYKFDIIIFNHVLMYMKKNQIEKLFLNLKKSNPKLLFLIGIGRQNFFSKLGKFILGQHKAHDKTYVSYFDQLKLIKKNLEIIKKKNVLYLTDVFYCSFSNI
tara:strand:+ start:1575 stop:2099 length:525 start_codon:yes stop_codon:yes gene_type:complete